MTISTRQNENPRGGLPLGFSCSLGELLLLGCRCLLISVQPFAYVGTNYSCYNRDKKSDDEVFHTTTSFLLEVRQLLHHITFLLNVLLVIFRSRSYFTTGSRSSRCISNFHTAAVQILPLDYDPDVSFANIENRLQMLIMNAREQEAETTRE